MGRANTLKNKVGREISDKILDSTNYKPFETTEIGHPIVHYTGHDVRVTKGARPHFRSRPHCADL